MKKNRNRDGLSGSVPTVGVKKNESAGTDAGNQPRIKMYLDIPTAAEMAGYSIRHFRRVMDEARVPIMKMGHKFFILGREYIKWENGNKPKKPL